jgi:hypothetical protein
MKLLPLVLLMIAAGAAARAQSVRSGEAALWRVAYRAAP